MTQNLEGMGFTVVPFGQGFKDMSPPTKEFYKLLMEGRIVHGGNPIMAWMAGNVVVDTDPAGNIKPTKAKSPEKIDGIVAAIMALDRCIRNEGQQQGSIYDEVSDECRLVARSKYPRRKDHVPDRRGAGRNPDAQRYGRLDGGRQCSDRGWRGLPRYQSGRSAGAGEGG